LCLQHQAEEGRLAGARWADQEYELGLVYVNGNAVERGALLGRVDLGDVVEVDHRRITRFSKVWATAVERGSARDRTGHVANRQCRGGKGPDCPVSPPPLTAEHRRTTAMSISEASTDDNVHIYRPRRNRGDVYVTMREPHPDHSIMRVPGARRNTGRVPSLGVEEHTPASLSSRRPSHGCASTGSRRR